MTLDQIVAIADVAAVVLSIAATALCFYVRATAHDAINKKCDALQVKLETQIKAVEAKLEHAVKALYERMNADHDRIKTLEGKVDDMPRSGDVHALSLQLASMAGDLKAITVKVTSIEDSNRAMGNAMRRVENHLFKVES